MSYISFYGAAGGVPANITYAVQDMVTGTTTGNVDYTSTTLGSDTPVAVLAIAGKQQIANEPSESLSAALSMTARISSGGWHFRNLDREGSAVTVTRTVYDNTAKFRAINQTFNGYDFDGDLSLISGGARVNYTGATTSSRAFFVAFSGSSVSAYDNIMDLGTSAGTTTLNIMSFEPDILLAFVPGPTADNNSLSSLQLCCGVAVNHGGGVVSQRCVATLHGDSLADSNIYRAILTDKIAAILDGSGNKSFDLSVSNFTSVGYDRTTSASAANRRLLVLALKLNGADKKLVDFTTPTSTGNHSITGVGFTPRLAIVFLTSLEAVDPTFPLTADDLMSGMSVCVIGDEQWSVSNRVDNLNATPDTGSRVKNTAILLASATAQGVVEATLTSFDSDGMTLNYSAVAANGKKGFILFLE